MPNPTPITIPLLNPNEPGAVLVSLQVASGQLVHTGEILCTLETTKSTSEVHSEAEGYIVGLSFTQGQTVQAGDVLCYLADSPDWVPPVSGQKVSGVITIPMEGRRISQPALLLAQQSNLDISLLPQDVFITEKMVRQLLGQSVKASIDLQALAYGPEAIVVYGGGGHGKALIDLIRVLGTYSIAGIVDDDLPTGSTLMGIPVLGGGNILDALVSHDIQLAANAVGGIGNILIRIKIFERLLHTRFFCPALVHPTAYIEPSASLGDGVQVMPHAYIGSEARAGFGVIINTGAIVSHDCILGDYANLSPGAILAGEVKIGEAALIGMGVTINLRVKVGSHARIGNGATVKSDVPDGAIVHAGAIWPG